MNKDMLSYTMNFVSFLVDNIDEKDLENIKSIVLFGSVARKSTHKESDIDLFVDVIKQNNIEKKIDKIKEDYFESEKFKKWHLRGIDNAINIIVDRMDKWGDLNLSIVSDGISLYSKYTKNIKGEQKVIIYWDKISPESKRVSISKKLYGYSYKKSKYKGLIELTNSIKLSSNCIISNLENAKKIVSMIRESKITVKTIYVNQIS